MNYKILYIGLITVLLSLSEAAFCQVVSSVSFNSNNEGEIIVQYYLSIPDEGKTYNVSLLASTNSGDTYIDAKSVKGDIGKISTSGWKNITWDVLKDIDEFNGPGCELRVQATEITSFGKAVSQFFSGSSSARDFVNGFALYGGWQNIAFVSSSFKEANENGTLKNLFGWNIGVRYVNLPFIFDANYINQRFSVSATNDTITFEGMNVALDFVLLPLMEYLDIYCGIGFQASHLSYKGGSEENSAQTNGVFWNVGGQINMSHAWRIGAQYATSFTAGNRNWNQILVFIGFNFSLGMETKK